MSYHVLSNAIRLASCLTGNACFNGWVDFTLYTDDKYTLRIKLLHPILFVVQLDIFTDVILKTQNSISKFYFFLIMQILAGDAESFEKEDMEQLICSMSQEEQTI